jgi:hypothetical protein
LRDRNLRKRDKWEVSFLECDVAEVASLFPRSREQLPVDGSARKFVVNDSRIESVDIPSLELLLSGEITSKEGVLIGFLGNGCFDRLFLNYSTASKEQNLFELKKERLLNFE